MSSTKTGWNFVVPPANQWQNGAGSNHGGEPAEEVIILTKCEAWPDDRCLREYLSNGLFSFGLGPVRDRRRCQARTESGQAGVGLLIRRAYRNWKSLLYLAGRNAPRCSGKIDLAVCELEEAPL